MMKIKLVLPWPPSVNHYWQRSRNGGMHISERGRDFRDIVERIVFAWCGQNQKVSLPLTGPVAVNIVCHPPDKRRRDIDNLLKSLLDSLQRAGLYRDDNQVSTLTISRSTVDRANPRVVICVRWRETR